MLADSPYTAAISAGVLKLQEDGILKELKIKWWEKMRGGGSCKVAAGGGNAQLSLAQLGGVFIVLVGGMVVSIIIAIFEFAWKRRKLAVDENVKSHQIYFLSQLKSQKKVWFVCRNRCCTRCGRSSS